MEVTEQEIAELEARANTIRSKFGKGILPVALEREVKIVLLAFDKLLGLMTTESRSGKAWML